MSQRRSVRPLFHSLRHEIQHHSSSATFSPRISRRSWRRWLPASLGLWVSVIEAVQSNSVKHFRTEGGKGGGERERERSYMIWISDYQLSICKTWRTHVLKFQNLPSAQNFKRLVPCPRLPRKSPWPVSTSWPRSSWPKREAPKRSSETMKVTGKSRVCLVQVIVWVHFRVQSQ